MHKKFDLDLHQQTTSFSNPKQKFSSMLVKKSISKRTSGDGKSRIMVLFREGHSIQMRFQTSVFVRPEFFNEAVGEIVLPKRGKTNVTLYNEAVLAKADLDNFIGRVQAIMAIGRPDGQPMTKDWIEHLMEMQDNDEIQLDPIQLTQTKIESALKKEQTIEEENRAKKEAEEREAARVKTELANAVDVFLQNQSLSDGRVRHYKVLKGMISRFTMYMRLSGEGANYAMYLDSVTHEDIKEFVDYIRNEAQIAESHKRIFSKIDKAFPFASNPDKPRQIGERGTNYINSKIKQLKAVINWHLKQGTTTNNPLVRLEMYREIYGEPIYITKEERDTIADFDLSKASAHLQEQRDIFVFQCLVGCRVGDFLNLTIANVHNGILEYVPHKTKDHVQQVKPRIPLCQRALDLIAKYQGKDSKGRLFPFVTAQRYNENIREIFKLCGINRFVIVRDSVSGQNVMKPIYEVASSHMARRTFVGAAYKLVKDPNLIGAMSGHVEGSQAFNRYRKIDDDDLRSVTDMM